MPPVRLQANHRSSRRTSVAVKCAHAPERRVPNHVWQLEARDMHHGRGIVTADVRKGVKLACGNAKTSKRGVEPHEVNNKKAHPNAKSTPVLDCSNLKHRGYALCKCCETGKKSHEGAEGLRGPSCDL